MLGMNKETSKKSDELLVEFIITKFREGKIKLKSVTEEEIVFIKNG